MLSLLTWNVNGIRAVMKKGLEQILDYIDADIVCFQETKAQPDQIELSTELYPYQYTFSALKKGYSGTMIASRYEPLSVHKGIDQPEHDQEGRVITLEFESFYLVTVYTPNSGEGCKRLSYRQQWDEAFAQYIQQLNKPVLVCGDLNIARSHQDIWSEADGENSAGYTLEEREDFEKLLMPILHDVFREKYPEKRQYTWWSYYSRGRENNRGWRIDYWLASTALMDKVEDIEILDDVYGSDHCPVELFLNLDL